MSLPLGLAPLARVHGCAAALSARKHAAPSRNCAKVRSVMEWLLARLERKLGRFAIHNFTLYLIGAMAFAFAVCFFRPDLLSQLIFHPALFARQPWRAVLWLAA